jgi:hypothetical protein
LKLPKLFCIDVNSRFEVEAGLKDVEKVTDLVSKFEHKHRSKSSLRAQASSAQDKEARPIKSNQDLNDEE